MFWVKLVLWVVIPLNLIGTMRIVFRSLSCEGLYDPKKAKKIMARNIIVASGILWLCLPSLLFLAVGIVHTPEGQDNWFPAGSGFMMCTYLSCYTLFVLTSSPLDPLIENDKKIIGWIICGKQIRRTENRYADVRTFPLWQVILGHVHFVNGLSVLWAEDLAWPNGDTYFIRLVFKSKEDTPAWKFQELVDAAVKKFGKELEELQKNSASAEAVGKMLQAFVYIEQMSLQIELQENSYLPKQPRQQIPMPEKGIFCLPQQELS